MFIIKKTLERCDEKRCGDYKMELYKGIRKWNINSSRENRIITREAKIDS